MDQILVCSHYSMRYTIHTTMQPMPMQLVFGHDAIINLTFDVNWHMIKQRKQLLINKNNET